MLVWTRTEMDNLITASDRITELNSACGKFDASSIFQLTTRFQIILFSYARWNSHTAALFMPKYNLNISYAHFHYQFPHNRTTNSHQINKFISYS